MQPLAPCLWFDAKAEEAASFYVSVFRNSKIVSVARYGDAAPGPKGAAMVVNFQLEGQDFLALNGGPQYTFTPAISFVKTCETQREIDDLWTKLTAGGQDSQCGWLTDKFGISWQIVPSVLSKLMQDKDPARSKRVMETMLTMRKLDIKRLQDAANERAGAPVTVKP